MIKILYITRVPMTAIRFIFPLAKRLRERGNIIEFAFCPAERLQEMEESGFKYTVLSMSKKSRSFKNIKVISQLNKIIKEGKYDVVHTYSPVMGIYGRIAAHKAKTPVVIHSVIGSLLASGVPFLHRLLYIASELTLSRMVNLFITLNDEDARAMTKYKLAPSDKVISLKYEYGIDLKRFNPDIIDKKELEQLHKILRLEDNVPIIGFIGRMIAPKGILDLFKSFQIIREKGIKAKLMYSGKVLSSDSDGSSIEKLKTMVREAGLENDVYFLGYQSDIPLYISLMDVVVLPSHHEGFPRIPVEAGAMRKPSVCTDVAGAEIAILDGKTGLIVPIKNPDRLAEAIQNIITNPVLSQNMGTAARERVVDLFDENKIVDQQIHIYEEFFRRKRSNFTI